MLNQKAEVARAVILAWVLPAWGFGGSLNICASPASPPRALGFCWFSFVLSFSLQSLQAQPGLQAKCKT